jgi:hypothetical protein
MFNFGPGLDNRKSTITLTQARAVAAKLANVGVYGKIYWNQESASSQADFVEPEGDPNVERVYVLYCNGNYHELGELAVWLSKPESAFAKLSLLYSSLGYPKEVITNIPEVSRAINETLERLLS